MYRYQKFIYVHVLCIFFRLVNQCTLRELHVYINEPVSEKSRLNDIIIAITSLIFKTGFSTSIPTLQKWSLNPKCVSLSLVFTENGSYEFRVYRIINQDFFNIFKLFYKIKCKSITKLQFLNTGYIHIIFYSTILPSDWYILNLTQNQNLSYSCSETCKFLRQQHF